MYKRILPIALFVIIVLAGCSINQSTLIEQISNLDSEARIELLGSLSKNQWLDLIKNDNYSDMNLSEEELKLVPEGVWNYIVPQIVEKIKAIESDKLGISQENVVVSTTICRGDECSNYIDDSLIGYSVVSRYRTTLSSSMSSTQATVPVASITTFDDHVLTMADLGGKVYLTAEPGGSREEIIKCTTISSAQWATCIRGLAFYGTTETAVSANRKAHNAGSIVVMSNVHYVYEQFVDKDDEETISGVKTFNVHPEAISTLGMSTTTYQYVTKELLDSTAFSGVATATESQIGAVWLGTAKESASSTSQSSSGAYLVQQSGHASSTPSTSATTAGIPIDVWTKNNGKIHQGWLDLTEGFTWSGYNLFTGGLVISNSSTTLDTNATNTGTLHVSDTLYADGGIVGAYSLASTTRATTTITNTTDELSLYSEPITGNTLGSLNGVSGKLRITDYALGGAGASITFRLKYGATTIAVATTTASGAFSNGGGTIEFDLLGDGATNAQKGTIVLGLSSNTIGADSAFQSITGTATEDSTGELELTITAQHNAAATDRIITVGSGYLTILD